MAFRLGREQSVNGVEVRFPLVDAGLEQKVKCDLQEEWMVAGQGDCLVNIFLAHHQVTALEIPSDQALHFLKLHQAQRQFNKNIPQLRSLQVALVRKIEKALAVGCRE